MKYKYNNNGKTLLVLSIISALFFCIAVLFFRDVFVLCGKTIVFFVLAINGIVYALTYLEPLFLSPHGMIEIVHRVRETHEKLSKEFIMYVLKNLAIFFVYAGMAFYIRSPYAASSNSPQYILIETFAVVAFIEYVRFSIIPKQYHKQLSELLEKFNKVLGERNDR